MLDWEWASGRGFVGWVTHVEGHHVWLDKRVDAKTLPVIDDCTILGWVPRDWPPTHYAFRWTSGVIASGYGRAPMGAFTAGWRRR